jgi:CheY-like chemotaxis protein
MDSVAVVSQVSSGNGGAGCRRTSVLVVEDDAPTRKVMRKLLENRGFSVETAGTVAEAMDKVGGKPDVVLLDLMLPDGNGGEVLEWMKHNAPRTPVSVLTGCYDPNVLKIVEAMHPDSVLMKPIAFPQILQHLQAETAALHAA